MKNPRWRLLPAAVLLVACSPRSSSTRAAKPKATSEKRIAKRTYNAGAKRADVDGLVARIKKTYSASQGDRRPVKGSSDHDLLGLRHQRWWQFKTIRPIARDSSGAYFYRFSLEVKEYRDEAAAVAAMNRTYKQFQGQREGDGKGDVSYQLIVGQTIYRLQTGCLMNKVLGSYYRMMLEHVMGRAQPEKHSLLRHYCGGGYALR